MAVEVGSDTFEQEVLQADKPVLIDFWGPQCRPCLALMPQIESLEKNYGEKVKFTKVDASRNRRLCLNLKVMSLPTFLFFKNGQEVDRLLGELKIQDIERTLKKIRETP